MDEWKKFQNALFEAKMDELEACKAKLAALLAAGNAMARRMKLNKEMAENNHTAIDLDMVFTAEDAAALEQWEQVTK